MENNNTFRMPSLGEAAPEFHAHTTQGSINFPSDFKGKWKMLFSHPADFTPVCTSEFVTFGAMSDEFKSLNCQLVGVSIDGLQSHIAWLRTIKEKIEFHGYKNVDIDFPLVADISMEVAKLYGMIQPGESNTAAVRAVFFVDPEDKIRTILYYPLSLGRNFKELKRVLIALQTTDKYHVSTPADWTPGEDVIMSAPTTTQAAKEREKENKDKDKYYEWFFCLKKVD
ncbi:MAG: peroxiredoxin [Rikenellaceae bacterium]